MTKIFKRFAFFSIALILSLIIGGHVYFAVTGDFQITYLLEAELVEEKNPFPQSVKEILEQPFLYLGQGHQTYVFASQDGAYVLKLFKKDYLRRNGWLTIFPPIAPFRSFMLHSGKSKEERKAKLLKGYAIANAYDREGSGLIYYHPEKNDETLVVELNGKQNIDLDNYVFAIQKKATTTKQELSSLLSQGNTSQTKERIRQLIDLYISGYQKGIFDHDHNLLDNTGFFQDRAIRQDVGKIVRDPELLTDDFIKEDLDKIQYERLGPWFEKRYPQYAQELIEAMHQIVEDLTTETQSHRDKVFRPKA